MRAPADKKLVLLIASGLAVLVVALVVVAVFGNACDGGDYCAHGSAAGRVGARALQVVIYAAIAVVVVGSAVALLRRIRRR